MTVATTLRALDKLPLENPQKSTLRNRVCIPTEYGDCDFCSFNHLIDDKEHFALFFDKGSRNNTPLVRIHSECMTGDLFHSKRCDCGDQLQEALAQMSEEGGVLLYLRQEGRGIGLYNKFDAYSLQLQGLDTYEANQQLRFDNDLRSYEVAAQMLQALNIDEIKLMTNNPEKIKQMQRLGIKVASRVATKSYVKDENVNYLVAKIKKTGHLLNNVKEMNS